MAGAGKKWLLGCGIGCLAVIVFLLALLGGGMLLYKDTVVGWRETMTTKEDLRRALGEIGDYEPTWDSSLSTDRLTAFLRAQERFAASGTELVDLFLQTQSGFEQPAGKLGRIWHVIQGGSHIGPLAAEFTRARSEALLAEDMNPGEYLYLHSLVYHCWLGRDPAGNAERFLRPRRSQDERLKIHFGGDINLAGDPQEVKRQLRQRLNERHRNWLRSMLAAETASDSPEHQAWSDAVRAELARLIERPEAVPWAGSFPPAWQEILEPFRSPLMAGWSDEGDLLELIMQQ